MQLKNVGVLVVILVPKHNTLTIQREERKKDPLSSFAFSLLPAHVNTRTYTHAPTYVCLCGSVLIVPFICLKQPLMLCWQCR